MTLDWQDKDYIVGLFGEFVAKMRQAVAKGIDATADNPLEEPKAGDATTSVARAGCFVGVWLGRVIAEAGKGWSQPPRSVDLPCPFKTGDWLEADRKRAQENERKQYHVFCVLQRGESFDLLGSHDTVDEFLVKTMSLSATLLAELREFMDNGKVGTRITRKDLLGNKVVLIRMVDDE